MKYILILSTLLFAGELEVDGDLTVLGNVNAPGLGGMKPERIYRLEIPTDYIWTQAITVPNQKTWVISPAAISGSIILNLNGSTIGGIVWFSNDFTTSNFISFQGDVLQFQCGSIGSYISIFEYPISATGTSQGMNYVEP